VQACIDDIAAIEADGIDRAALKRIGARLSALASETGWLNFDSFPLPTDPAIETAVHTVHVGAGGKLPLQVLAARPAPTAPRRVAQLPHQHPTWAAAACVRGATFDTPWLRSGDGDRLIAQEEVRLTPGRAFTMMAHDIHSVRGDAAPSLHLLLYGRAFERAVVFDPASWRAYEHRVAAIAA
jgi:predicted metal-dependent enzyme (double-stranded beta helix superfamily)